MPLIAKCDLSQGACQGLLSLRASVGMDAGALSSTLKTQFLPPLPPQGTWWFETNKG